MGVEAQRYHGWWVFAVPQNGYWTPECHRNAGGEVCARQMAYKSPVEAINAAKDLVDQAISRSALLDVLDEWLVVDRIDEQEHSKLMQSVYSVT